MLTAVSGTLSPFGSPGDPRTRAALRRPLLHASLVDDGREMFVDHLAVGLEPVAVFDELSVPDGPHLHPAAALMIGFGYRDRGHHAAERKALDVLHAFLDVLTRGLCAALGLDGIADGFRMQRGVHDATIIDDAYLLLLRRRLALGLVHRVYVPDHLEVRADAGELQRIVAVGHVVTASGLDVVFRRPPDQR